MWIDFLPSMPEHPHLARPVILDFSNVLGLDSSAAQSIAKLKSFLVKNFNDVEIILFVTGHEDGFRCSYDLTEKISGKSLRTSIRIVEGRPSTPHEHRFSLAGGAIPNYIESKAKFIAEIPGCRICASIDDALIFAEDVLIALEDPTLLKRDTNERFPLIRRTSQNIDELKSVLETLCPEASYDEIGTLASLLSAEKYHAGDIIWEQGDASDSLKIVIRGTLVSLLEDDTGSTESIIAGSVIGELGLVNGTQRLTTVKVFSDEATIYSLGREGWETLTQQHPNIARFIDMLVIRYLAHRVQHAATILFDSQFFPV
jgi:SulP family sulfate permease